MNIANYQLPITMYAIYLTLAIIIITFILTKTKLSSSVVVFLAVLSFVVCITVMMAAVSIKTDRLGREIQNQYSLSFERKVLKSIVTDTCADTFNECIVEDNKKGMAYKLYYRVNNKQLNLYRERDGILEQIERDGQK